MNTPNIQPSGKAAVRVFVPVVPHIPVWLGRLPTTFAVVVGEIIVLRAQTRRV